MTCCDLPRLHDKWKVLASFGSFPTKLLYRSMRRTDLCLDQVSPQGSPRTGTPRLCHGARLLGLVQSSMQAPRACGVTYSKRAAIENAK